MPASLEVESTLTDRYQTAVPQTVRRTIRLSKGDNIHCTMRSGGEIVLTQVDATRGDDPVLGEFLALLAHDMASHPEHLLAVDARFLKRLQSLTGGIEVELDSTLSPDDE